VRTKLCVLFKQDMMILSGFVPGVVIVVVVAALKEKEK
jgi:hypothetical protein